MTTGLVKPNGLPTFQSGNPLAADMLFYGVDLGNGTMVDVAPGGPPLIAASSNPPTISTSYGSGIDWDNQNLVDGDGYYANVDNSVYQDAGSTIQNALNLAAAGPGAGFTFGCTFVELGPTTGVQGLIFGRPAYAAENAPYWNEAFTTTGSSSPEVDLVINNDGVADVIGQYDFGSYGTVVSLICTVQNTSDGSGIAKFFASSDGSPGVLVAEATVSADSTYGIGHDQENQIMFGSVYHVLTGVNWNSFNGPVFSGFIAGTAWTDAEAISWLSNPYELLSWAPLAAPSITSVTGDAGTIGNGASTNDPDPTVQVSLSGTGAQAGDTLQLFYDGTGTSTPLGISYTLTSTDINNGFATVQTGRLTNGTTYSLTAHLTDQAGNQSDASSTFTVIENTALPAVIWANGISGTWQTASDWTPSVVPGASNNVFILPSGTSTVTDSQSTTIDSVVTAANATLNITGGTFTITNGTGSDANAGTIEVEGGATLNILAGTLTNTGTLEAATGGTLDLAGTSVTNTNATVTVASGSTFNLENATLTGGNLADSGAVHVALDGTSTLSGVTISVGSTGETETVTGSLALDGNAFSSRPFESSTSASVALTTKNADDVIILEIVQNGTTVSSVSDTADLTWNLRAVAGTGPNTIYEYYAIAPNALSADAITVDLAGTASYVDLNAFGISGANTLSPFDTSVLATPVSSTGTVTTSNADDLVFASYRFASDASPSAGSSWTAINASGGYYLSEYQITSATQTGLVATASTTDENGGIVDAVQASTSSTATVTGALTVDAGSTLDLVNTTITGGVLTNAGTVDVTGDSTSALSGVSVSNATGTGTVTGSLALDGNAFSSRPFVSTSSAGVALTTKNADDVIILEIVQNGTTVSSVSDTADLTWNVRAVAGTGPYTIYEYYAIAPNALSADAITVDFAGTASYVDLNAFGISGANTSSPFDTSVPVTPATSTGTVTTSNADDLVFASYRFTSDATPSAGPSWTAINASGGYYLSEYQITSAPQTGLVATASTADENGGIVDSIVQANLPVTTATMAIGAGSTLDFSTSTITNGTLSNSGTLVVTGGGASTLDSMSVTSPGGTVGAITIDLGSTLDLEKTTIVADALINAGTVDVTGGNTSTLSGVSVTNTTGTEPVTGSFALDGNGFSSRPFVSTTSTSVALTTANADDVIILEIVQNGSTVSSVSDTADLT